MIDIYLAGGMRSGWQDRVKEEVPAFSFFDPRSHGLVAEKEYTPVDLAAIDTCGILFAYLEETNPAGMNMCLEIGYAKKAGKLIIFVDEKRGRYFGMARACADIVLPSLEEGIELLWFLAEAAEEYMAMEDSLD